MSTTSETVLPTVRALGEDAAAAAVTAATTSLGLPTVRAQAAPIAQAAVRGRLTHLAYLAEVLAGECEDRDARRKIRRVKEAKFPRTKRLEDFDTGALADLPPATLAHLATGEWIEAGEPLVLLGDSGTGKTHLLIALGTAAAEQGRRVRYTTTAALVNELIEAADQQQLSRVIARYGRYDLLCLDEIGYVSLDTRGAELLFQLITEREERASIACASNAPFSEWGTTFTDPDWPRRWWTGSRSKPTSSTPAPIPTDCGPPKPRKEAPPPKKLALTAELANQTGLGTQRNTIKGGAKSNHHNGAKWACHSQF